MKNTYLKALKTSNKTYKKRLSGTQLSSPKWDDFLTFDEDSKGYDWVEKTFPRQTPLLLDIDYDFKFPEDVFPEFQRCELNVKTAVEIFGGTAVPGWQILKFKDAIYWATEHWLWEEYNGRIRDITPDSHLIRSPKRLTVVCHPIDYVSKCYVSSYDKGYEKFLMSLFDEDRPYIITEDS